MTTTNRPADLIHRIAILRGQKRLALDSFHAGQIDAEELDRTTDAIDAEVMAIQERLAN